jgi:hypothetical protein
MIGANARKKFCSAACKAANRRAIQKGMAPASLPRGQRQTAREKIPV